MDIAPSDISPSYFGHCGHPTVFMFAEEVSRWKMSYVAVGPQASVDTWS